MTKKYSLMLAMLLLWLAVLPSCTPSEMPGSDFLSILTAQGGRWRIVEARFGDEEALPGLYDDVVITFGPNGSYRIVNPSGAQVFNNRSAGIFTVQGRNLIIDGTVTAREVSASISRPRIVLEWEVSIPGKMTTTYRFVLAPI